MSHSVNEALGINRTKFHFLGGIGTLTIAHFRAGSRIFRRGGRGPILGGFGLQRGHFSVKMYAKTKELGPVGGACAGHAPPPPRSAYAFAFFLILHAVIVIAQTVECKQ